VEPATGCSLQTASQQPPAWRRLKGQVRGVPLAIIAILDQMVDKLNERDYLFKRL
jgi:hypothetical protein